MYEIRPEAIITFLEDRNVRFPRFQRRQTWNKEKNFKLCVSLFKGYPLGVTIINFEQFKGKNTRWLLDGRQRRNALRLLLDDPENIYEWGQRFLKLKPNDQPQDVAKKFWSKIDEYLEDTDNENFQEENEENIKENLLNFIDEDDEYLGDFDDDLSDEDEIIDEQSRHFGDLKELLNIITIVHNKTKKYSGFTRPFDFTKKISNLSYIDNDENGNTRFNGKKLKSFIKDFEAYRYNEDIQHKTPETFSSFMKTKHNLNDDENKWLKNEIKQNWEHILNSIHIVENIENILRDAKIGIIETRHISPVDAQMIFTLINSEGTKLTPVEILSAKPSWNIPIKNPVIELQEKADDFYKIIGTEIDKYVRWDYPATLYDRLRNHTFLFSTLSADNTSFNKKLSLGFKVLSGVFQKGVKKEDVSKLSENPDINWERDIDALISDLNLMNKIISEHSYFRYLNSWNTSIQDMTSDNIAFNFLFLTYLDWERKGKPAGSGSSTKIFMKNAFILLDTLIYEYLAKQWRGSSDARIANNIKKFVGLDEVLSEIDDEKWLRLLGDIISNSKIENEDITFDTMKAIVYHNYAVRGMMGPNDVSAKVEVDHIIPQTLFKESTIPNKSALQNNLFNLSLLEKRQNASKSNKRLIEIKTNKWLCDQIVKYAQIDLNDFELYSDVGNWDKLREKRRIYFEGDFIRDRRGLLNN